MANEVNWFSVVYLAVGGVVFVAIFQMIDLVRYRFLGIRTSGRVMKLQREAMSDESDGWVFTPVIEYVVGEQPRRIKPAIAIWPALYEVGQEVPVYYFAGSPGNGRIVTAREFFKWMVVLGSCLLLLVVLMHSHGAGASTIPE